MKVFCIEDFKQGIQSLRGKKQYDGIELDIIDHFFEKSVAELKSGTRLNNNDDIPYIKKRIRGRGGFRVYYLLLIYKNCLYLLFIHPKTGPLGTTNITNEYKALILKKIYDAIKTGQELYLVTKDKTGKRLLFERADSSD